jgi:hypothetical protein
VTTCEICGDPLGECLRHRRPRVQQPCARCRGERKGEAREARRKHKLATLDHFSMDLGKRCTKDAHIEYHASRDEMSDIALLRKESELPWVWDGRKWVYPRKTGS